MVPAAGVAVWGPNPILFSLAVGSAQNGPPDRFALPGPTPLLKMQKDPSRGSFIIWCRRRGSNPHGVATAGF